MKLSRIALAAALCLASAAGQATSVASVLPTGTTTAAPGPYVVESIRTLTTTGGRLTWSADGQWIYYDRREADGYFDLFRMRPDGTANECLTCGRTDLPSRHIGNPTLHPSGRFVVFQVEKEMHAAVPAGATTIPGGGAYNDLWLMDLAAAGRPVTRLTNVARDTFSGSLHPHFSNDGRKLLWTDFEAFSGVFFDSRLAVADLVFTSGVPALANLQHFNPGPQPVFIETHGWGPGDAWVYFACTPKAGMADENMDICRMDFATPTVVTRMTASSGIDGEPGEWDEHGHLSPAFDAYTWMSSRGFGTAPGTPYRDWLKTELWLRVTASSAPQGPQRLTFFNQPGHAQYRGERVIVADHAWSPDGREIAIYLQLFESGRHEVQILRFAPR
ncbi:MAG TPA: hypothetical protein VFN74_08925 [Chloroflexota bacterium]|jgi:hypothetical protein|nr:hypothetical protein [Chloroflexota bacterium]